MSGADGVNLVFKKIDTNRDHVISPEELGAVLRRLDAERWTQENIDALFEGIDRDKDGKIKFGEFVDWIFQEGDDQEQVLFAAAQVAVPIEEAIVNELTWARTKPAEVAEVLRGRLDHYNGLEYSPPERPGANIVTKEGVAVVFEAIKYLEEQAKDPTGGVGMTSMTGLLHAAEDHIADIGQTGTASHTSSDGTNSAQRARRYGTFTSFGECLWYGSEHSDARMMVLDLIVDDGVPTRGHRHGVYNPEYDCVGTAYGPHSTFGRMAALEFARGWHPDEDAIAEREASGPYQMDPEVIEKAKKEATTHWNLGVCAACHEPIKGGRVVNIPEAGGKMHVACFKCSECEKPLSGVPYNHHKGTLFCSQCFQKKHGEVCKACGKPISGAMAKCALGAFHVDCLICSKCDKPIGRNKFSTTGGVLSCNSCASAAPIGRPAVGGASAAPIGRPAAGGGRSQSPARGSAARSSSAGPGSARRSPSPATRTPASPTAKAASAKAARSKPVAKKAAAKPKAVTMSGAREVAMGMAMDYADLA